MTGTAAERISCSTYAYGHWDLGRALESIARVGYTGVEILTHGVGRPDGQGGRQMNYHLRPEWPEERIAAAEELLGRLRLQAVCLSPSTDFLGPRHGSVQADVDEVCRHVDLAVRLGAPLVRPFAANTLPEGMDAETAVGQHRGGPAPLRAPRRLSGRPPGGGEPRPVPRRVPEHGGHPARRRPPRGRPLPAHPPPHGRGIDRRRPGQDLAHAPGGRPAPHWQEIRALRAEGLTRQEIAARLGVAVAAVPEGSLALGEGGADLGAIVQAVRATGYSGWWNHEGGPEPNPEPVEQRSYTSLRRLLLEAG